MTKRTSPSLEDQALLAIFRAASTGLDLGTLAKLRRLAIPRLPIHRFLAAAVVRCKEVLVAGSLVVSSLLNTVAQWTLHLKESYPDGEPSVCHAKRHGNISGRLLTDHPSITSVRNLTENIPGLIERSFGKCRLNRPLAPISAPASPGR
jgi:hypothetical protein